VGATVVWNLVSLRAETRAVSYLDDSSLHEQMVRFATAQWRGAHLPLTSWFPYLGLGSPQSCTTRVSAPCSPACWAW